MTRYFPISPIPKSETMSGISATGGMHLKNSMNGYVIVLANRYTPVSMPMEKPSKTPMAYPMQILLKLAYMCQNNSPLAVSFAKTAATSYGFGTICSTNKLPLENHQMPRMIKKEATTRNFDE